MSNADDRVEPPVSRPVSTRAGDAYGLLISEQLVEERARKSSLESRAAAVVTTSGALVTLLFAFGLDGTAKDSWTIASGLVAISMLGFVAAALGAIAATAPRGYEESDPEELARLTGEEFWVADWELGSRRSAELRVEVIRSARAANGKKATALTAAFVSEGIAVLLLAAGLGAQLILSLTGGGHTPIR